MGVMSPDAKTDRVCPYCPLHCDDLIVSAQGEILSGGCEIACGHSSQIPLLQPTIAGQAVTRQQAEGEAARLLGQAHAPLISGLACDVDGLRAAVAVADQCRGFFDHGASDGFFNGLRVLQRRGALLTSPAEVRNRADVLVVFANQPWSRLPRFFDRYVPSGAQLFNDAPANRKIVLIGGSHAPDPLDGADVQVIPADLSKAAELALVLGALVAGRTPAVASSAGIAIDTLKEIAQALKAASYGVVAWENGDFGPHGDLAVEALYDLILTLNQTTRAAGLPLPPGGHVSGAHQVGLWQAGTPLRTCFTAEGPVYDSQLYSRAKLLADGRADLVLWISAMPGAVLPKIDDLPVILLSSTAPPDGPPPRVYIPVATPSLDHDSVFFRGEGVVSLHASRWRSPAPYLSVAETLAQISNQLPKGEQHPC